MAKGFLIAVTLLFVGAYILFHGMNNWTTAIDLIIYTGVGFGVMIFPMRTYLYTRSDRRC